MCHRGIAAYHGVAYLLGNYSMTLRCLMDEFVYRVKYAIAKFRQTFRPFCVIDSAYHIEPAGDLIVVIASCSDYLRQWQKHKLHRDRRRADVYRYTVMLYSRIARLDINYMIPLPLSHKCNGNLPVLFT